MKIFWRNSNADKHKPTVPQEIGLKTKSLYGKFVFVSISNSVDTKANVTMELLREICFQNELSKEQGLCQQLPAKNTWATYNHN